MFSLDYLIEYPFLTALMTGFLAAFSLFIGFKIIHLTIWSASEIRRAFNDYRTAQAIDKYCADVARSYREAQTKGRSTRELSSDERSEDPLIFALRSLSAGANLRRYRNDIGALGIVFEGFEPSFRGKGSRSVCPEDPIPEWLRRPSCKEG